MMHSRSGFFVAVILTIAAVSAMSQWLSHPTRGIPRTADGKPNLSAPAPRTADGKLDLSGIWQAYKVPVNQNLDIKPGDVTFTPQGEALQQRRKKNYFPGALCLPGDLAYSTGAPFKIFASSETVVILYEHFTTFRQIFLDGRPLPRDPNPTWMGYSVGKWDGDTLVVDTTGFNDSETILPGGRPHSDALHLIERFRRRDFGHLEIQFTIEDPEVYTKPWTFQVNQHLLPDTELLEYVCNENEKDLRHMVGGDR
jgi:hypothetical protein